MSVKTISFVTCCYNEADNIPNLYNELEATMDRFSSKYKWNLLIVDDGSIDATETVVSQLISDNKNIDYLCFVRNFGKEAAITAGIDYVTSDAAVLLDGDLQHPVNVVSDLLEKWEQGFDMVVAIPEQRQYGFFNNAMSKLYHRLISWFSDSDIIIDGGDFRLLDKKHIQYLKLLREKNRYMKGLYGYPGGNVANIVYQESKRTQGESSFNFRKRLVLGINGIISFSSAPIRLFTLLGLITLLGSFCYLIYILIGLIIYGKDVPGFASLLFMMVILNGLIMLQIGIQGEYIAQLLKEVKQRPLYLIDETRSVLKNK